MKGQQKNKIRFLFACFAAVLWFFLMLKREPNGRARLRGIRDYCLRRFGDAPSFVKALNAEFKSANEHA